MKKIFCLIFLLMISCGPSPEQLFETAEFEVLQTNYPHATKLFREIIERHPNSKFAEKARIKLKELEALQKEDGQ